MVATSATRDAANSQEFTDRVVGCSASRPRSSPATRRHGCRSPARPGSWPARPDAERGLPGGPPYLVTDIGGGSTEFVELGGPEGVAHPRAAR
jgi:exopolyphosphatase/guanosine-5'-triphosphate,3'-diphosphate pyrophosphatase